MVTQSLERYSRSGFFSAGWASPPPWHLFDGIASELCSLALHWQHQLCSRWLEPVCPSCHPISRRATSGFAFASPPCTRLDGGPTLQHRVVSVRSMGPTEDSGVRSSSSRPGGLEIYDIETRERVGDVEVGKQAGGIAFWKTEP